MGKDKDFISIQKFIDKKVIDISGVLLGDVRDLRVSLGEPDIELVVTSKIGKEIGIPWSDIQSIEDFIILKKTVKQLKLVERVSETREAAPPPPPPKIICQSCGSKAPGHAKFCPKCGNKLK